MLCKNCNNTFNDEFKYCPECGQKANDRLTFGVLFNNTISNYFSIDARFFKSFFPLIIKPGYLAIKFVEGKRLMYLHPAQFYLFISVIFFFLLSFNTKEQQLKFDSSFRKEFEKDIVLDSYNRTKPGSAKSNDESLIIMNKKIDIEKLDSLIAINASEEEKMKLMGLRECDNKFKQRIYSQVLKFYIQRGSGILETFYSIISISLFFLMPLFAFLLKFLFFRNGQYSHHLVFSLYFFTFLFTVFSIILIANFITAIPDWIDWLIVCATSIYLLLGIMRFYKKGFIVSSIKTGVLLLSYTIIVLPISLKGMGYIFLLLY